MMRPRPMDILCRIALQALAIDVREHIELPVGIADARSPNALTIDFLVVLQRETILSEVKAVEAIGDVFPVDKVLRMKDDETRNGMHRRTSQIVIVAHAQDVGVAELIIEQRIRKRAIAIVGRPRLSICRKNANEQSYDKQEGFHLHYFHSFQLVIRWQIYIK